MSEPTSYQDETFVGEDWYGRDLSGLHFTRCALATSP